MEVSGQLHVLAALPPSQGNSPPQYPLDRMLGGPQSQTGHSSEEKYSKHLLGIKL